MQMSQKISGVTGPKFTTFLSHIDKSLSMLTQSIGYAIFPSVLER